MRRFLRFGVWSLAALLVVTTALNLTVARLPVMPPADGKYITLHGKEIHYTDQPGEGVPVVMIHGLPASSGIRSAAR
jgi:pimeloyl-ACP methyl ester carboxylesterase